jgi:hypothetical protein
MSGVEGAEREDYDDCQARIKPAVNASLFFSYFKIGFQSAPKPCLTKVR